MEESLKMKMTEFVCVQGGICLHIDDYLFEQI